MLNFTKLDSKPLLPRRQNNLNKFSTYITICNQNNRLTLQWKDQPSLKRNLKLYEKKHKEFYNLFSQPNKEINVAHFWRKIALNESQSATDWEPENKIQLAYEHLASYFEEICYWTANDLCTDNKVNSWEEYLFSARLLVYNPLKLSEVLLKYDFHNANLETYMSRVLTNHIQFSVDVNRFSRWRLLCKKSDKELKEALEVLGIVEPQISQFIFARKYFKQVYVINKVRSPARSAGQRWIAPDQEDFEQSAQCYNAEKLLPTAPHEVYASSTQVTANQIEDWMNKCIKALENYPKTILPKFSFDAPRSDELEAKLASQVGVVEAEWQQISAIEETSENQQYLINRANPVLSKQLQTMKPDYQKVLFLYYGFGLNQKQVADRLGVNQGTISRNQKRTMIQLQETLAKISQPQQWVQSYVERWLQRNYRTPLHSDLIQAALVSAAKKLTSEEREILQLYYGQQMDENQVSSSLGIHRDEITRRLMKARNELQDSLMPEIGIWMKEYLEKWLSNHYQSFVKSALETGSHSRSKEINIEDKISLVEMWIQNQY